MPPCLSKILTSNTPLSRGREGLISKCKRAIWWCSSIALAVTQQNANPEGLRLRKGWFWLKKVETGKGRGRSLPWEIGVRNGIWRVSETSPKVCNFVQDREALLLWKGDGVSQPTFFFPSCLWERHSFSIQCYLVPSGFCCVGWSPRAPGRRLTARGRQALCINCSVFPASTTQGWRCSPQPATPAPSPKLCQGHYFFYSKPFYLSSISSRKKGPYLTAGQRQAILVPSLLLCAGTGERSSWIISLLHFPLKWL